MPYDFRIIQSKDFLRLDAEGHFDLDATRRVFSDVIWACSNCGIGRVLLDVRDAASEMTAAQLAALAQVCEGVAPPGDAHKIAILARPKTQQVRASIVAAAAGQQGWNVGSFGDFEEAFHWLIV